MDYIREYEKWKYLNCLDADMRKELKSIELDETAKINQFSSFVEFGTAGMRGTMGIGPNRMNIFTIRRTTIGLAKYIKSIHKEKDGVVIIYDTRNNSKKFAEYISKVLSEYGIKVFISKDVRPTPFLSYAVLSMKAVAGINITASHNRKEDNGYKIYLSDGAQFSAPDDKTIIKLVNETTENEYFVPEAEMKYDKRLINFIPSKVEKDFLDKALSLLLHKDFCKKNGKNIKVVYTPLHGTGYVFLEEGFKRAGFTNVYVVKSQNDKCGEFKTVAYPNPESALAFTEALKLAKAKDADIVVATDPDADRLGVYVRVKKGKYMPLTGNELASVLFEYIAYFKKKRMNLKNALAAKSFVTTRLLDVIAKRYGIEFKVTPTGFKWIGKEINKSKKTMIFGAEESYGAVLSDYVRDKDAIGTTLFVLEMALVCKNAGFTLYQMLNLLYNQYGTYKNYVFSTTYEGVSGKSKINSIMNKLINTPFASLAGIKTMYMYNYNTNIMHDFTTGKDRHFEFVPNNTVKFVLADDTAITIRPSGTEPKIKIYFDIHDKSEKLTEKKFNMLEKPLRKILA